jgi:hypothetical protein
MGPQEIVDRHFLTEGICVEMEDVVGAFFVALQPRLNAVKVAAKRVYFAAANIDHLRIAPPRRIVTPADFESTWQVANFVKHRDEWRDVLLDQQQECFDALVALGVAKLVNGSRELDRWTLISAACAISGETTLANAVPAIVQHCESACHDIENSIQGDFSCIATEVDALRSQNAPKRRVRAHNELARRECNGWTMSAPNLVRCVLPNDLAFSR